MPEWAVPIIIMCVKPNQPAMHLPPAAPAQRPRAGGASVQLLSAPRADPVGSTIAALHARVRAIGGVQCTRYTVINGARGNQRGRLGENVKAGRPDSRMRASRPCRSLRSVTEPLNGTAIQTATPLGG